MKLNFQFHPISSYDSCSENVSEFPGRTPVVYQLSSRALEGVFLVLL